MEGVAIERRFENETLQLTDVDRLRKQETHYVSLTWALRRLGVSLPTPYRAFRILPQAKWNADALTV